MARLRAVFIIAAFLTVTVLFHQRDRERVFVRCEKSWKHFVHKLCLKEMRGPCLYLTKLSFSAR